jgi:hypothetical protein
MGHDNHSSMTKNGQKIVEKICFLRYLPDFVGASGYGQN